MAKNEQYSHKEFTHQTFADQPARDFANSEIIGSCFYQEAPYRVDSSRLGASRPTDPQVDVFPSAMTGVTFVRCNLMNVKIPAGNTVDRCQTQRLRIMNDADDWVLDDTTFEPVEPLNKKLSEQLGISVDPSDIPTERQTESPVRIARRAR